MSNAKALQQAAMLQLRSCWPDSRVRMNPCPRPVDLTASQLEKLRSKSDDIVVTPKLDGIRHQCVLFTHDAKSYAVLCTMDMCVHSINVFAPRALYMGTVLDCELIRNRMGHILVVAFDIYKFTGRVCTGFKLDERIRLLQTCLLQWEDDFVPNQLPNLVLHDLAATGKIAVSKHETIVHAILSKPYQPLRQWASASERPRLKSANDGLILNLNSHYPESGLDRLIWKWKPILTVDLSFRWIQNKTIQLLALDPSRSLRPLQRVSIDVHRSVRIRVAPAAVYKSLLYQRDCVVLECELRLQRGVVECFPVRAREDRQLPNTLATIRQTIICLLNRVTLEDLLSLV